MSARETLFYIGYVQHESYEGGDTAEAFGTDLAYVKRETRKAMKEQYAQDAIVSCLTVEPEAKGRGRYRWKKGDGWRKEESL